MATPIEATPIEACQMEFAALSKLQLENHTSSNANIETIFAGAIVKRTWYATFPHKMDSEVQNDKIKFKVLHTPHYLARVYITQKLPALRVKQKWSENDEVQICWSHNAGNNVVRKGEMIIGSSNTIQTIDSKWMDDYIQLMVENGNEKFINDCQGNHPFLEQWNNYLPRYTLTPIQPYFFESDTESAFPIHRIHQQTDISFKYTRFTNFREMLRMRKKIQGTWKEIAFNKTYIEGNYGKDELPLPEMWGIYFVVSKAEIESISNDETGKPIESFEQIIDDVIEVGSEGVYTYDDSPSIEVQTGHPCRLITMKAENSDFAKKRNYSNYTTNVNVYEGWSPIKKLTSLKYGPNTKIANAKSPHISRMLPYYHCPRVPYERGYNIISFSSRLSDYNFDSGAIMSNLNVRMQLALGDTNPMITTVKIYKEDTDKIEDEVLDDIGPSKKEREKEKDNDKDDNTSNTSYKIIVRALISKTLVYSKAQDGKHYNVFFKKHEVPKK